ncbi:ATP-dependent DNA helicase [Salix suchowensis]|nr:ATP-dependent DNA helicase [Salix suchowensis]
MILKLHVMLQLQQHHHLIPLISNYKLWLIGKRDDDSRQYDDPSSNDIGGLIVGDIGNFRSERDIIIEQCSGSLQRISKLHPKFMALQYPLLFPYGDDGYRCNIMLADQDHQPQRKRSRVPMRAYYAYLIHERQFLVDAFANVEEDRLDYIRDNQSDLRSEIYKGIHEYLFKYVSKGSDRCRMVVQKENNDEIKAYLNCRFICPYEAVWRLFQFPIHSRHPPVELAGVLYPTFQLACKSLGLLGDDKEWADALNEAILTATSLQIRQLFVSLVLFFASSGIASLLLPGGRTAHSRFKIPLMVSETSSCEIKKNTNLSHLLEMTSLIIWDEAPMNHRCCFEALDRSLRDILAHDQPFGGKTVLLGGDFRQILPVVTGGTREDIIHASLSSSPLWHEFKIFTLNENMRLSSNGLSDVEKIELQLFAEWILMIGNGEIFDIPFEDDYDTSLIKIPPDLLLDADSNPIASMVSLVYPCINNHCLNSVYFQERAIVTPKNSTVSMINDFIFDMLPENKHVYLSCDSVSTSSTDAENADLLYPVEFLNQLEFNGVPSHKLSLQVGTPIMLLRNLNPSAGLCNGTRLLVTQLADKVIEAQIITGSSVGSHVFIPRITFPVNDERCSYTIRRRQFPIRPCYINKSQGQSLKVVGVFLQEQVFTHGQLYVALSRVTSKKGLKIITLDDKGKPLDYAKNIVYKDIISSVIKS